MIKRYLCLFGAFFLVFVVACEFDFRRDQDRDGIADRDDNCPTMANPDQREKETMCDGPMCISDGFGDPCDNCPGSYNPDQADTDGDGLGDVCDGPDTIGCRTSDDCPGDMYCFKWVGQCNSVGHCEARPEICTNDWTPVCGCDGQTYGNTCQAAGAGVSVLAGGECE